MSEDYRIKKLLLAEAKGHLAAMSNPAFPAGPILGTSTGDRWNRLVTEVVGIYGDHYERFRVKSKSTSSFPMHDYIVAVESMIKCLEEERGTAGPRGGKK